METDKKQSEAPALEGNLNEIQTLFNQYSVRINTPEIKEKAEKMISEVRAYLKKPSNETMGETIKGLKENTKLREDNNRLHKEANERILNGDFIKTANRD